jgi:hypothetical protein
MPDGSVAEESKDVSHFLRKLLLPFLGKQQAAGVVMHHPPKLTNRDTSKWTAAMWQYSAHGSAEWTNAPRWSMTIEETASPTVFQFIIGKRGSKSGWKKEDKIYRRYFKYSDPGEPMYWKEATEEDVEECQRGDNLTVQDIVDVFTLEQPKMPLIHIREALKANGFKVDNDWLANKLKKSPQFRKGRDFWMLRETVEQEEKEQKKEKKQEERQEKKEATLEAVFEAIQQTGEINTARLFEIIGGRKETLLKNLDTLLSGDRIQVRTGFNNAKLYSVKSAVVPAP